MAYAAVRSVKRTLLRFVHSYLIETDDDHWEIDPSLTQTDDAHWKIIGAAYYVLDEYSLADRVRRLGNSEKMKVLAGEITEAAWKLQDTLESLVSDQFFSQSGISADEEGRSIRRSVYLDEEAKQVIFSFIEVSAKLRDTYDEEDVEASNMLSEEAFDVSSRTDYGTISSKMVGLSDQYNDIKESMLHSWPSLGVIRLSGMAGIGKSTIAKKLFEDPSVVAKFKFRIFVTLGQKYQLKQVMLCILTQMGHNVDEIKMQSKEELADYLYKSLQGQSYLIVLDDVWNRKYWLDDFERILPNETIQPIGSKIIVTTRLKEVADTYLFDAKDLYHEQIRFLNKEESWELLREKVFGQNNSCPYELEKVGKKIAEVCEGLALTIVTVARLLLDSPDKTPEYWNKVAEKRNSVFADAYEEMYEVLYPSYAYLPHDLQGCFLYMGVFPLSFEIPSSKLYNLWKVEDVHEESFPNLRDLVYASIVLVRQKALDGFHIKTCYLHSVFHYLCVKEAEKINFFHLVNSNTAKQCTGRERRLCIQNNVFFGIDEVSESMKSMQIVRSMLCMGEYHRYPVQICLADWRLLKVVDALTIRFYEFPMEVLKLFQLTYLALTCNKDLPTSISKLFDLEYLIVHRYPSIKDSESHSYLPMNIWRMKKLKHLEVIGSDLLEPDPSCGDAQLQNLERLLGVSTRSCTQGILSRLPNLHKLGIQIEFGPDDCQPLSWFDQLSPRIFPSSLKCGIVNPNLISCQLVPFPNPDTIIPSFITKLSLSGFGYPWEHMRTIGQMRHLETIKLRDYAFRGPTWETNFWEFEKLKYLLIEDTDLEYLTAYRGCFQQMKKLIFRHCYKLKKIPSSISSSHRAIELVDCPAVDLDYLYGDIKLLSIHSSWDE